MLLIVSCRRLNKMSILTLQNWLQKCDISYVGQTGRQLKTRIAEHRKHIN